MIILLRMNLKKPKFWNLKRPNIFAYLLFPFSILIGLFSKLKRSTVCKKFKNKNYLCWKYIYWRNWQNLFIYKNKRNFNKKKKKSCFVKKFYKNQYDEQKLLERRGRLFYQKKD